MSRKIRKIVREEIRKMKGGRRGRRGVREGRRSRRRGRKRSLREGYDASFAQQTVDALLSHRAVAEAAVISVGGGDMSIGVELTDGRSMGFYIDEYFSVEFSESWSNSGLTGGFGGTPQTHGLSGPRPDDTPEDMARRLVGYTEKADQIRFM